MENFKTINKGQTKKAGQSVGSIVNRASVPDPAPTLVWLQDGDSEFIRREKTADTSGY